MLSVSINSGFTASKLASLPAIELTFKFRAFVMKKSFCQSLWRKKWRN